MHKPAKPATTPLDCPSLSICSKDEVLGVATPWQQIVEASLPANSFVWINLHGEFLAVSLVDTILGKRSYASFTKDLDLAYVAGDLPKHLNNGPEVLNQLTPILAWSERTVRIGKRPVS
jgi:hypothetical protein